MFRDYDIRGLAGKNLRAEEAFKVGKSFGTYMGRAGGREIIVGMDARLSSPELQEAAIEGLISTGCCVTDVGQVPTPVLYYAVIRYEQDGGLMITASHNPSEYNGFKMRKGRRAIFGKGVQELRRIVESETFLAGKGSRKALDVVPDYIETLKRKIRLERNVRVVVDAGNGTVGPVVSPLLQDLGCDLIELYCEPDGRFPHHMPDPTVDRYLDDLRSKVREEKADLGVAYDGDGDRLGVVDEEGGIIRGDQLLLIFARDVLRRGPANVVFDVKCSQALIDTIIRCNGTPVMWKTGYPHIQSKMEEVKAPVAGEMSGHMYFSDNYFGFDDGIFASLRALEILARQSGSFSGLLADLPRYHSTPEIRTQCSEEEKFAIVEELKTYFATRYETIQVDGVRILFEDGWALIRPSNTQPILVLRFEATTERRLKEIQHLVVRKLEEYPSVCLNGLEE